MKTKAINLVLLLAASLLLAAVASCSESSGDTDEYANWQSRNSQFFAARMSQADDSIAWAKRQYGTQWQQKATWRKYLCYSLQAGIDHSPTDSICLQILQRGDTAAASPLATDSVRIFYRTMLIPTDEHPSGIVADHSGLKASFASVFDVRTASPATFRCDALVKGVATALLHMHPGDLWRVYIPSSLAYAATKSAAIPAHSTIVFEMYLVDTWRIGTVPTPWR